MGGRGRKELRPAALLWQRLGGGGEKKKSNFSKVPEGRRGSVGSGKSCGEGEGGFEQFCK